MHKVTGIGGFFFRAENPEALSQWYTKHLGIDIGGMPWQQTAGMTVFQPFTKDTDYFKPEKQWMIEIPRAKDPGYFLELASLVQDVRQSLTILNLYYFRARAMCTRLLVHSPLTCRD